jgi:flagellar basal body-associated protein FliL
VAGRWAFLIAGGLIMMFFSTTAVMASSTPEDIYTDYVADGKLTEAYSDADFLLYLSDASLAQYADADINKALVTAVKDRTGRARYPSAGFQIALIAIAVVVLVVGGILLRYFSRPRKAERKSVRGKRREVVQDEGPVDDG